MGVIIKYQLAFTEAKLKVSNDIFGGDFVIDADITVQMRRGQAGCSFEIKLYDLPLKKVKTIEPLSSVTIKLGYFDGSFEQVTEGIITKIISKVEEDKLVTKITGLESGTYALQNHSINISLDKDISLTDAVSKIFKKATFKKGKINQSLKSDLKTKLTGEKTFNETKIIKALDELAAIAEAEFLVCGQQVFIDQPVKDDSYQPDKFAENVNLAKYEPIVKKVPEDTDKKEEEKEELILNLLEPLPIKQAEGFDFIITGDPQLRPGQKVVTSIDQSSGGFLGLNPLAGVTGFNKAEFRVLELDHKFIITGITGGYTCEGRAITASDGDDYRKRETALIKPNAERFVQESLDKNEKERRNRPSIEVGAVKEYTPKKHLTTLYFGQSFPAAESQPSLQTKVNNNEELIFKNKPIISLFAWHKCGLVTPIYPGMKALLNHNRSLPDDVLITGFMWSKTPEIEPPPNQKGDWWLCLPIDFDTTSLPKDDTKAVNDLIANNGQRVIQVKGLKITVGKEKLPNVGVRPTEGEDDEFLIEHTSGTKIRILANGKIEIEADSLSIKGNVEIQGNLSVK